MPRHAYATTAGLSARAGRKHHLQRRAESGRAGHVPRPGDEHYHDHSGTYPSCGHRRSACDHATPAHKAADSAGWALRRAHPGQPGLRGAAPARATHPPCGGRSCLAAAAPARPALAIPAGAARNPAPGAVRAAEAPDAGAGRARRGQDHPAGQAGPGPHRASPGGPRPAYSRGPEPGLLAGHPNHPRVARRRPAAGAERVQKVCRPARRRAGSAAATGRPGRAGRGAPDWLRDGDQHLPRDRRSRAAGGGRKPQCRVRRTGGQTGHRRCGWGSG